jgi:hypothetical protein
MRKRMLLVGLAAVIVVLGTSACAKEAGNDGWPDVVTRASIGQRAAITAQTNAETADPTLKALASNGYRPVWYAQKHNDHIIVFKKCGTASFANCAAGLRPGQTESWVLLLMNKPAKADDVQFNGTIHFQYYLDSKRDLRCEPTASDWKLNDGNFALIDQIRTTFQALSFDTWTADQEKQVGDQVVHCGAVNTL